MARFHLLVFWGLFISATGCTKSEPTAEVCGKVTLDEKPLAEGEIFFITLGRPPQVFPVREGGFAGKAWLGQRRVEIYAYRPGKLAPNAVFDSRPGEPDTVKENYIPARYNADSTLQADVDKVGPNRYEFNLKSD